MNEISALFLGGPADKKMMRVACRNGVPEPYRQVIVPPAPSYDWQDGSRPVSVDLTHETHIYTLYPRPPCRSFDGGVILQVYMHDSLYAQIIKQTEFDITEYLIKEYWQRNG